MHRFALSDDICGRVVARSVRNAAGTILLERGMALDARIVACLRSLGITHVFLQNERGDGAAADPQEQAIRVEVTSREERRFGDVSQDPNLAALLAATVEIKVSERLAAAGPDRRGDGAGDA